MKATNEPNAPADPAAEPVTVPPSPLYTPEQIEELKTRAASAQENWDRLLRTTADFDNFKKRAARERTEAAQNASQALLLKLLPILDGFDMAQTAAQSAQERKCSSCSGVRTPIIHCENSSDVKCRFIIFPQPALSPSAGPGTNAS